MKITNLYKITMYLSLAVVATSLVQIVGVDPALASANQLTRKMTNVKSNTLLIVQSSTGISVLIGLLWYNFTSSPLAMGMMKAGSSAVIISFMWPSIESFLKTLSGS